MGASPQSLPPKYAGWMTARVRVCEPPQSCVGVLQ